MKTKDRSSRYTKGDGQTVMAMEQNDRAADLEIAMHDGEANRGSGSTLGRNNVAVINSPRVVNNVGPINNKAPHKYRS